MLGARVPEPLPEKETEEKVRRRLGGGEGRGRSALRLSLLQGLDKGALDPPKMIRKHRGLILTPLSLE